MHFARGGGAKDHQSIVHDLSIVMHEFTSPNHKIISIFWKTEL